MNRPIILVTLWSLLGLSGMAAGQTTNPYTVPVVTVPSSYWGYVRHPYADTLDSYSRVIRATAEYNVRVQEAAQKREETRNMKLQTRKKELEFIKWRRDFVYQMRKEEREREIKDEIERSRERPNTSEILAGTVLNNLLEDLKKSQLNSEVLSPTLKAEWIENLNITCTSGNAGLLRQKKLQWPLLLQITQLQQSRERVNALIDQARNEVKEEGVTLETVKGLMDEIAYLDRESTNTARTNTFWSAYDHIQALQFTSALKQTVKLLKNPKEAAALFGHLPKAKTVTELIRYMRENGLKFGPASPGSEQHYIAFHDALAREHRMVQSHK